MLLSNTTYLMKVLFREGTGGDFVRVQYSANSGSFSYFQANTLTNLKNGNCYIVTCYMIIDNRFDPRAIQMVQIPGPGLKAGARGNVGA